MMNSSVYSAIIGEVQKPSRYIGGEVNSFKGGEKKSVKIALVFPDLYEMGMSNLGLRILYNIINKREDSFSDRFFSPDTDFEQKLKEHNEPLRGLDSGIPLNEFSIIGFTLQYELSYTNVLNILKLNKIPLHSSKRSEKDPFIIAGGPCAFNPEPMASFFDFFVIGDGENIINDLIDLYKEVKRDNLSKKMALEKFSALNGIYVPSLFEITYDDKTGGVKNFYPLKKEYTKITKNVVSDLDIAPYPTDQIVPFACLVHDRIAVEIDRGCTHGCRFCQAGIINRPVRERSVETISHLLDESIKKTGYEEISLSSLSAGDYSKIHPLLSAVMDKYSHSKTSVSFPSLRADTLTQEILNEVGKVRNSSFTIAAEAGTQRLRQIINKKITDDDIFKAVHYLAVSGWRSLKLYFMVGLPGEKIEDVEGIVSLCKDILYREKKISKLTVSVSTFIPKSHTPFQWCGQKDSAYLAEAYGVLSKGFSKNRKIAFKGHDKVMSFLESVFSRGDRRLGSVIEKASSLGCSFDGWSERVDIKKWNEAFAVCGIDPKWYSSRNFSAEDTLAWDHIKTGVSKKFLLLEYEKSKEEITSSDCKTEDCLACGLSVQNCLSRGKRKKEEQSVLSVKSAVNPEREFLSTYRIIYKKMGIAKYLSHLELGRLFHRAIRRANLPVKYSEGFHPHPKMSFGYALPVGTSGINEQVDIAFSTELEPTNMKNSLNKEMPEGMFVDEVRKIEKGSLSIMEETSGFKYSVTAKTGFRNEIEEKITEALSKESIQVERTRKESSKTIDIRPAIKSLSISGDTNGIIDIKLIVANISEGLLKPNEILSAVISEYVNKISILSIERENILRSQEETCHLK